MDGLLRTMNHPIALSGQMQHLRTAASETNQLVEQGFGTRDFKPRPERATGIHKSKEILRIFANRFLKHLQRIIKAVPCPERTRLLQFGHINAKPLQNRWRL